MFREDTLAYRNGQSATVSIKNWIFLELLALLSIIPIIGFIIYLGIYIYYAFNKDTAVSVSNYIKANLIVSAVVVVVVLIIALISGAGIGMMLSSLS